MARDQIGFSFNADLDYMSNAERLEFEKMQRGGRITFFRTAICRICRTEVLKGKTYCSKRCKMDKSIEATITRITDERVTLETKDGSRREGLVTNVMMHSLMVDGEEVFWPRGIVLNRDKNDEIPWDRLAWIETAE